jgi:CHAT domain-containing protein
MERVENEYPEFYQLTSSGSLDVEAVQSRVLGPEQTLVEYVVGEKQLSVFVVTSDRLIYRSVDASREKLARMLADLSDLFDKDKKSDKESGHVILSPQLAGFSIPPARALYDVLIAPVEAHLREGTELIIAPDDVLFYLPFEVLVAEAAEAATPYDFGKATFLLEKYAVSYAPSASVLGTRFRRPKGAQRTLLAFGNPDFGGIEEDQASLELMASTMPYAGGLLREGGLIPLPNSETEVKAIGGLLRRAEGRVYTGKRATEDAFKREGSRFRILHFATHFLVDDRQPLYSKIVLAKDEQARQDGYLQTYEIFNTKLNAELVVLSACNTGLGKLSRGEGLIGMSRAFWYAGVPSLVVSLWSVEDEATSIIMESFYRYLSNGANKREALRRAKLDYLAAAQGAKKDPFYWAPFILMGDWQPIAFPPRSRWLGLTAIAGLGLVLLIVSLVFMSRRKATRNRAGSRDSADG